MSKPKIKMESMSLRCFTFPVVTSALLFFILILAGCASPEEKALAYYEKGAQFLEDGKFVEAALEFRNALQRNEDLAPAWRGLAEVELKKQRWRRAFAALKRVTEIEPDDVEAHEKISELMFLGGNVEEALEYNNRAYELKPDRARTLTLRALILFRLGDVDAALVHARRALELDPESTDALLVLAAERVKGGDAQAAVALVDQGLQSNPKHIAALLFKLNLLQQQEDFQGVETVLRQMIEYYPEIKGLKKALVAFFARRGDTDTAEKELRAFAAEDPEDAEAQLEVVRFLNSYRGIDVAREELQRLVKVSNEPFVFQLALAQIEFSSDEYDAAETRLSTLIANQTDPDKQLQAKNVLARMLVNQGRRDSAQDLVAEVLATDDKNVQALSLRAQLSLSDGEFGSAITDLRTALGQSARSPEIRVQLGRALELDGAVDLAEESYAVAMRESNFRPEIGLEYARFLRRQRNFQRAETVLAELRSQNRSDPKILAELANVKLQLEDWEGAEQLALAIDEVEKGSGIAAQIVGAIRSGQQEFDQSIEAFRSSYLADPEETPRLVNLVRAYLRSGRVGDAENFLASILKASPDNAEASILNAALKARDSNRAAEAEADLKEVIEKAPENPLGYRALANFYATRGRRDEAETIAREGLRKFPDNITLNLTLAGYLQANQDFEEAIMVYERLYELRPQSQLITNNLASLLADHRSDQESLDRAFELANRLRSLDFSFVKDTLGWVHYRRGENAAALQLLEEAVKELPNVAIVRYHLAQVYLKEERLEDAKREFEKALEIDENETMPFREQAKDALAQLSNSNQTSQ